MGLKTSPFLAANVLHNFCSDLLGCVTWVLKPKNSKQFSQTFLRWPLTSTAAYEALGSWQQRVKSNF